MTITYPLATPAAPGFRTVRMRAAAAVGVSSSPFTFAQTVQAHPGQAWQAGIALPPMKRAAAAAWQAFLLSLNGAQGTFLLGPRAAEATPRGSIPGVPLVDGAGQTGQGLATKGWTPSQSGVLLSGDYFQLGSGLTARLHKVLADADSDSGGLAALDIWPRLRETPGDGDPLVVSNPAGLFRLAGNTSDWDIDEAEFYGLSFDAVEAL